MEDSTRSKSAGEVAAVDASAVQQRSEPGAGSLALPSMLSAAMSGLGRGALQRKLARRRAEGAGSADASQEGAGTRGLKGGGEKGDKQAVRGIGDTLSDAADVIGTGVGNAVGGVAGAITGISISQATLSGPTFGPQGAAEWHVSFGTTGRTGWLVQEIQNTVDGQDATGTAITAAGIGLTPSYYEAWSVDATGLVSPNVGGVHDMWDQGAIGPNTKGHWSTQGKVYWVAGAAAPAGMAPGGVPSAGILHSSVAAPPGLGIARLHRYAHASWDATAGKTVDVGSAG